MIVCVDGARSLNEVAPMPTMIRVSEWELLTRPGRMGWGPEKTFLGRSGERGGQTLSHDVTGSFRVAGSRKKLFLGDRASGESETPPRCHGKF